MQSNYRVSKKPLTTGELVCWTISLGLGFGLHNLLNVEYFFDIARPLTKGLALLITLAVGVAVFWALLRFFGVPRIVQIPGAMWGVTLWSTGMSNFAYLALFVLPVEISLSAILVGFRCGLAMPRAMLAATVARVVALLVVIACRPALIELVGLLP